MTTPAGLALDAHRRSYGHDRVPPQNLEAERSVLGDILLHNEALHVAADIITPSDFYRKAHGLIFDKMTRLAQRGEAIDLVTLKEELGAQGLDDVGGPAYITALVDGLPSFGNVEHHARLVKAKSRLRALISVLGKGTALAYEDHAIAASVLATTQQHLETIAAIATCDNLPPFDTLDSMLAEPEEPLEWRIEGLQPAESRALLAAQFKAGKTTFVANVVRALADGEPLLGVFSVCPTSGRIVVLDFEMSERQSKKWYRAQRIHRADRVIVRCLRGLASSFDILNPVIRRRWADRLRAHGTTYLVLDCLRPVLDAFGLDEHRDAGRLLVAIDALLNEAGIPDALIVHHMGHSGERSRGDSRLRDWPDCEWKLVRKTDDAASLRFLSAYGRDVDVPEGQLSYDGLTRRLALVGGSRQDARLEQVLEAIAAVLNAKATPMSGRAIKEELADSHARNVIDEALRHGRETGALTFEEGPRSSILYRSRGECPSVPSVPAVSQEQCVPVSRRLYKAGRWDTPENRSSVPEVIDERL